MSVCSSFFEHMCARVYESVVIGMRAVMKAIVDDVVQLFACSSVHMFYRCKCNCVGMRAWMSVWLQMGTFAVVHECVFCTEGMR